MAKGKFGGGGFPGGGNMNNMLKQAQKMQQEMLAKQEETEKKTVESSVGGGAVTVVMSGKKELLSIKIKPEVIDPGDAEMLEDLILTAINDAAKKADAMMESSMSQITGGLNLPGLF